jgi:hypothetical protein
MGKPRLRLCLIAAVLAASAPVRAAEPLLDVASGADIDEGYRAQFDRCDQDDHFYGATFKRWEGCRGDPNRARVLKRLADGAVAYESKLAVDLDGSAFACGPAHGRTDQCDTALELSDATGADAPLDADLIPYVVIPQAGPGEHRGEFTRLTGVKVGDFGVVIYHGRVVPVIVGDTGPYNKIGEGSLALHRALGRELCVRRDKAHVCRAVVRDMESIDDSVVTVLFPGSARQDLTPQTLISTINAEGARLWARHRHLQTSSRATLSGGG